ncbi:MAG: helix-turn-helix transcriptional regulator [Bacteroidetes bacterium]|nr:helix-turn-helix transcriptional regulator [Bacteroidota bacterium]
MGYRQKDVARLLGLKGAGRISEWESGTSVPSIENLIKLSVIYQTLCEQLYTHVRRDFIKDFEQRRKQLPNEVSDKGG